MRLQIFGILNFTPDSFFDGGKHFDLSRALQTAQQLIDDGASYIDIGAEATNPFVEPISAKEEVARLKQILPALLRTFPNVISLDTYHPETLEFALKFGKPILNDVSGLYNPATVALAKAHDLTCIVGHLPAMAKGMPVQAHEIKIDSFEQVVDELKAHAQQLEASGIQQSNLILDPNIGFGKSMRLNWQLLEFAKAVPDYKVMIGHSNKRFLGCDSSTGKQLENGQHLRYSVERNLEAATIAKNAGTAYLRVHDPHIYQSL